MKHGDLTVDDIECGRYIDHDTDSCGICGSPIEYIGDEYTGYVRCTDADVMLFQY